VAVAAALGAGLIGYAAPAGAAPVLPSVTTGGVGTTAAPGTPTLAGTARENIQQLVQCGSTMFAVGTFSLIAQSGVTYTRTNIFSFSALEPYTITTWAPSVNGIVNTIAFNGTNCADAYIGGQFTDVSGTAVKNIAEISTSTGDVVSGFDDNADGEVASMLGYNGHLLVGGYFKRINGTADPAFASLSPGTGKDDGFLHLNISGYYHYCNSAGKCTNGTHTDITNMQLSHGGTLLLAEGDFTSVGGYPRQQIFMLNLANDPATVTGWTSPEWDGSDGNLPNGYPYQCWFTESAYIRSAAWSAGDSTIYIATTGYHPWNLPTGTYPRSGLCDAAAAFPATQMPVTHLWVNYTGCDSYYSAAADNGAVYVAGHQRWTENPNDCDHAGPGAVKDPGLHGLDPATGNVQLKAGGSPEYSMSRANASAMIVTTAGLWIGSSNRFGSQTCDGAKGHSGICFLPYP
jgi:hypothetical protein